MIPERRYHGSTTDERCSGIRNGIRLDRCDAFKNPGKTRIYQTKVRQLFHTNGVDIVSLLCLQKSRSGGESSISSSVTVHDEMWQRAGHGIERAAGARVGLKQL